MEICSEPTILRLTYIILLGIKIVSILIPIIIIIMCSKDVINVVMSKDPQGELKSKLSVMLKRLATGIAIFFIPTIVNVIINMVPLPYNVISCWNGADTLKKELERKKVLYL